jgi:hypothetical protein
MHPIVAHPRKGLAFRLDQLKQRALDILFKKQPSIILYGPWSAAFW